MKTGTGARKVVRSNGGTTAASIKYREYAHLLNPGTFLPGTYPGASINRHEDIQSPAGWSIARHDQHLICHFRRR